MDPTTIANESSRALLEWGIIGVFIIFLIALYISKVLEGRENTKSAAAREAKLGGMLNDSQNARIEEGKEQQKELSDGLQVLRVAIEFAKGLTK